MSGAKLQPVRVAAWRRPLSKSLIEKELRRVLSWQPRVLFRLRESKPPCPLSIPLKTAKNPFFEQALPYMQNQPGEKWWI
jgi:hypothetical protein